MLKCRIGGRTCRAESKCDFLALALLRTLCRFGTPRFRLDQQGGLVASCLVFTFRSLKSLI
jgi:hypothetical protein